MCLYVCGMCNLKLPSHKGVGTFTTGSLESFWTVGYCNHTSTTNIFDRIDVKLW